MAPPHPDPPADLRRSGVRQYLMPNRRLAHGVEILHATRYTPGLV
jgi:hypothetical protein